MSELQSKSFGTLRWLRRNGQLVLQELWVKAFSYEEEWRDIPIVELDICSGYGHSVYESVINPGYCDGCGKPLHQKSTKE